MEVTIPAIMAANANAKTLIPTIETVYAAIAAHDDPALFIALRPKAEALEIAARLDEAGPEGRPLFGVPFVVKDNIDVAGLPTTAGCAQFTYFPKQSAFVVAVLEQAGAIVIGKTNLDQFATGLVGVRSPFGAPRNALRADLIPGGSSSGSATAVGAGIVPFALGTDTAGSGRVPAAMNGIVGLKPSLGALSNSGVVPACRTLDTISIFALDVADAQTVFNLVAQYDATDFGSRIFPAPAGSAPPKHWRVGVPAPDQRQFFGDVETKTAFCRDIARLETDGATVNLLDFEPFRAVARLLYEGPWVAERYAATKPLIETHPQAFHPITRTIIEGAKKHDAVAYFEASYKLAMFKRELATIWSQCDVIAVPTIPRFYTRAEVAADPIQLNGNLGVYTNFVNLLDWAAIAVPAGRRGDGLPSSLTLIGPSGSDSLLAALAGKVQQLSGTTMGATGRQAEPPLPHSQRARLGRIELAVVGAHLSGLALNRELIELGAVFLREVKTVPHYRLFALPNTTPPKPGLLRVMPPDGGAIACEVWALDAAGFGAFVAKIPAPLGIGTLNFDDGTSAKGFLVEAAAVSQAKDITHHGGWRAYVSTL